ncbi:MAG: protein-tyrosine-phosphatase [Bacteroidota bacterium]
MMMPSNTNSIFTSVQDSIQTAVEKSKQLSPDRQDRLKEIAAYIQDALNQAVIPQLTFICTHNSRRSHLGQIWAKVMADYYGYSSVRTYSGGTEATAFNPNAIAALRVQGLEIVALTEGQNPHYNIRYSEEQAKLETWSKVFNQAPNPQASFCAIMTCSEADEACPVVFGASKRVALPYEDPKKSDGTPEQAATYQARSLEIATEMAFLFQQLG